jgi:hypothetical protein
MITDLFAAAITNLERDVQSLSEIVRGAAEQIELARVTLEAEAASTITPEGTLRAAGIDDARQAEYQRKMWSPGGKGGPMIMQPPHPSDPHAIPRCRHLRNGHPKWKAVDLDAPLKGWEQYDCVKKYLAKRPVATAEKGSSMNPVSTPSRKSSAIEAVVGERIPP